MFCLLSITFVIFCQFFKCSLNKFTLLLRVTLREKSPYLDFFFGPYFPAFGFNTPPLSVFSPNTGKHGPEKFRIRTLFTQCYCDHDHYYDRNILIKPQKIRHFYSKYVSHFFEFMTNVVLILFSISFLLLLIFE